LRFYLFTLKPRLAPLLLFLSLALALRFAIVHQPIASSASPWCFPEPLDVRPLRPSQQNGGGRSPAVNYCPTVQAPSNVLTDLTLGHPDFLPNHPTGSQEAPVKPIIRQLAPAKERRFSEFFDECRDLSVSGQSVTRRELSCMPAGGRPKSQTMEPLRRSGDRSTPVPPTARWTREPFDAWVCHVTDAQ